MIKPEYISLEDWAGSLLTDYANYNLPILMQEEDWKTWAEDLLSVEPFRNKDIPYPEQVMNKLQQEKADDAILWQEWARVVYFLTQGTFNK